MAHHVVTRLSTITLTATAFLVSVLVGAGPAHAASKIGPLDQHGQLGPYCQQVVFRDMAAKWAISASPDNAMNPYTWKCRHSLGVGPFARDIDMNAACRWAYRDARAYAQTWSKTWAWSWDCWK